MWQSVHKHSRKAPKIICGVLDRSALAKTRCGTKNVWDKECVVQGFTTERNVSTGIWITIVRGYMTDNVGALWR